MRQRARLCGWVACVLAGCASLAGAQPGPVIETTRSRIDAERRGEHVASFDHVWRTIAQRQWDPDFDAAAWERQRDLLRPRVRAAFTDAEARAAMIQLVRSLGKSHFGIIPAEAYDVIAPDEDALEEARSEGARAEPRGPAARKDDAGPPANDAPGDTGITVRLREGRLMVVRVRDGSPAAAAGVEPGWAVRRVGALETSAIIEAAHSSAGVERAETICALAVQRWLSGDAGSTLRIGFSTPDADETREITLAPAPGREVRFGNLPATWLHQETRTLPGGIGYYALNIFLDPPTVMPAFEAFIRDHADAPGIVIDMRGNLGGIIAMSMGMGGWFVDRPDVYLGTLHMPGSDLRLALNPRDVTFRGPVAVLIDEASISNAELLAAGLKDIGRARVFGTRSAGLLLPSVVELLPNGDGFQYAIAGYTSASGESPEGVGVEPHVTVAETAASLAREGDPVLDAALAWIAAPAE